MSDSNDNDDGSDNDNGNKKSRIIKKTQKVGEKVAKTIGVTGATTAAAAGGAKLGLTAVGFSSTGPVAGSPAAQIQALIGNVAAGSIFSILQSVAMGGITTSILPIASGVGAVAGGYYWLKKSKL